MLNKVTERIRVRSRNKFGTGCHASLKCRHETGTVKRAWQQVMPKELLPG